MSRRSDIYYWRLIATAASFTLFGLGGLSLRLVVFPLLSCLPGDAVRHRQRARYTVSRLFWLFIRFMTRTGVLSYEVHGQSAWAGPGK